MQRILSKIFGTSNDRAIKRLLPLVEQVNALEPTVTRISDADLRGRTTDFRQRLENGEPLDDLLPKPLRPFEKPPSGPSASDLMTSS